VAARKEPEAKKPRRPPATTPEGRENQLISQAYDLAEKQLADGTASAQVISIFLKAGSTREVLEKERLKHEVELMRVKAEAIEREKDIEKIMLDALDAMRSYKGEEVNVNHDFG
jgi:hypothetical protein